MTQPPGPAEFYVPVSGSAAEVAARLAAAPRVEDQGTTIRQRTLLDTFDWVLQRGGSRAETVTTDAGPLFCWQRSSGGPPRQLPVSAPRFAWDLPPGACRREVETAIQMRALLPLATVRSAVRTFAVRNRQDKVVARLRLEHNTLLGKRPLPLRTRLILEPVTGYPRATARVRQHLLEPLALEPAGADLLEEVIALRGLKPGAGASAKARVVLEPELPAANATQVILQQLFDALRRNQAGTITHLDSEFLHDFRVAVRRTRTALSQLQTGLSLPEQARFEEEFGWLGTITSPTRDLDVYLLNFPEYQACLPPGRRDDLVPLRDFLLQRQGEAQQELARHLHGARYRALKRDWQAFLRAAPASAPPTAEPLPVIEAARSRIWKLYRRTLREGAALTADSPAEGFHTLRKTCKKLRYLLEFFESLFPGGKIATLVRPLKLIQDNLGLHNDLDVQGTALAGFGQRMQAEGHTPAPCLMAMGMLVEDLGRRQVKTRRAFAGLFAHFATEKAQRRFRRLFAPPARSREKREKL